jgi:hypothetical protein
MSDREEKRVESVERCVAYPAKVGLTVDQVEAYLKRTGWAPWEQTTRLITWVRSDGDGLLSTVDVPKIRCVDACGTLWYAVRDISIAEGRAASDVLADIAREPVS